MKQFTDAMNSYFIVMLAFLVLVIILPANKAAMGEYHLTLMQYHILYFLIVLPLLLIWFVAFFGYGQLRRYASVIAKTKEGSNFRQLALGCKWLAWSLPVTSLLSVILSAIVNSRSDFKAPATIIENYINMLIPVIAFAILGTASRGLVDNGKLRVSSRVIKQIISIFVTFGVLYCFTTFRELNLQDISSTSNRFYLPTWLIVISITLPYLYAWFNGLMAAFELAIFGRHAHGILYRRSLRILAFGIGLIVFGSIALQYLNSVEPRTLHISLNSLLLTGYGIRFISGIGYCLTAYGAIQLRKIEEV